jgi:predicted nucleic acid-binding protein
MSTYLLDSGFLYALIDEKDSHFKAVSDVRNHIKGQILFPAPAVTEVCYFVKRNLGLDTLVEFLGDLSGTKDFIIESPTTEDYLRSSEILRKYNDSNIDFVDACIVAIAERLNITKILTVDHRHFRMFKPTHCKSFELIPEKL